MNSNNLNLDQFNQLLSQSEEIVLVDFYADWCGPCQIMKPIFEELSHQEKYQGRVKFLKINVDNNPQIVTHYNIFSIPTFVFFKQGEPVKNLTGAISKESLAKEIDSLL